MAIFLNINDAYRLIQRELPEGVYPDGSPSGSYSAASVYSKAKLISSSYDNMFRIYENYFPQTADEKIEDWVFKTFETPFDPATTLQTKRDRVISKLRKQPSITLWEILTLVASYLPEGKYAQIAEPCGVGNGFWEIGISLLGINTLLAGLTPEDIGVPSDDWCEFVSDLHWRLGLDELGVTTELSEFAYVDIAQIQANAYQYEIRIFDYTLPALDLENMLREILQAEPARSGRIILQNLNLADYGLTNNVPNVGQFDLINCITRNSSSTTGYDGKTI